jgi:GGDEF domain-containing protein
VSPPEPIATTSAVEPLKTQELQYILKLAAGAVSSICSANDECFVRLDQIEEGIEETSAIEGVRVLRFRLLECLQELREHSRHQKEEMSRLLAQLQEQLEAAKAGKCKENKALSPAVDGLSGLEAREAAELAVAAALERGGNSYAALFVVDRLHTINAQFGYSTGDRVLRAFCGHVKSFLSPQDQLFRWTGPAFVGLLDCGEDPAEVRADIERIAGFKLEVAVQIGNRSILLPVACASLLVPLTEASKLADVTARLDVFTSERVHH